MHTLSDSKSLLRPEIAHAMCLQADRRQIRNRSCMKERIRTVIAISNHDYYIAHCCIENSATRNSCCMVRACVRSDNARASASVLSRVHMHKPCYN